jgi:hypothetical protein
MSALAQAAADMNIAPIAEPTDVLVERYIKLRDAIKTADDNHKAKVAPAREMLAALEGKLMAALNAQGADNVKTPFGTVYKSEKKTATIADGEAFRKFVIEQTLWNVVDWKANANAVADFITEHNAPPPGVNFNVHATVGVRRK